MKNILSTAIVFGVLACAGGAMATAVTFDFTGGDNSWDTDSWVFAGDDGVTEVTATASPTATRNLYLGIDGLGVFGDGDYSQGENSQLDGWNIKESIFFTFSDDVTLVSMVFAHLAADGNDDFSLLSDGNLIIDDADIPPEHTYVFQSGLEFDNFEIAAFEENDDFYIASITVNTAPVPEPATMLLFGTGLLGLVGYNRKRLVKKS